VHEYIESMAGEQCSELPGRNLCPSIRFRSSPGAATFAALQCAGSRGQWSCQIKRCRRE
jgi:hypothetical protein